MADKKNTTFNMMMMMMMLTSEWVDWGSLVEWCTFSIELPAELYPSPRWRPEGRWLGSGRRSTWGQCRWMKAGLTVRPVMHKHELHFQFTVTANSQCQNTAG